ncbi:MAG: hypothetical protein ACLVAW_10500 [Eisenbergiella massiliensis]
MLKDPSLRIGDIAEEVGFLDMAHFFQGIQETGRNLRQRIPQHYPAGVVDGV